MNFKVVLHLAKILALSSVRANGTKGSVPTGFAKSPLINIITAVIAFPTAAILANRFVGVILGDISLGVFFVQISIFLPSLMILAIIMYGLLFEFSQSSSAWSSDVINWLPIRALEFVLASVLSMIYFLVPILAIVFGTTFGVSLSVNMVDTGLLSLIFGVLGMFVGAFLIEIVRAITNRVPASFYKRSGRTTVAIRMLVFLVVTVAFILVSNINFVFALLQQFMGGIGNAWFIPILWPSLAVMSYLTADVLHTIIYVVSSMGLAIVFLWGGEKLREKYWIPAPFSIKMKPPKSYIHKPCFLGSLGFSAAEAALIKKDLRGLTRRKEMIVWIAVPLALSLFSLFSSQTSWETATTTLDKIASFWGPLMGVFMLAFYIALTGIGQEGNAFLNLIVTPLKEKEIFRSKLTIALSPSFCALVAVTALIQVVAQLRLEALIAVIVTLFAVLFECAFVGLALGSRFPDFTEVPRARFVNQKGVWLGMLIIAACVAVTFLPPFLYTLHILEYFHLLAAPILSAITCILICYASYQATLNSLQKLTHQP